MGIEYGRNLREYRDRGDLSQEEFAKLIGIKSRSSYTSIETGSKEPTEEQAKKIYAVTKIPYFNNVTAYPSSIFTEEEKDAIRRHVFESILERNIFLAFHKYIDNKDKFDEFIFKIQNETNFVTVEKAVKKVEERLYDLDFNYIYNRVINSSDDWLFNAGHLRSLDELEEYINTISKIDDVPLGINNILSLYDILKDKKGFVEISKTVFDDETNTFIHEPILVFSVFFDKGRELKPLFRTRNILDFKQEQKGGCIITSAAFTKEGIEFCKWAKLLNAKSK